MCMDNVVYQMLLISIIMTVRVTLKWRGTGERGGAEYPGDLEHLGGPRTASWELYTKCAKRCFGCNEEHLITLNLP